MVGFAVSWTMPFPAPPKSARSSVVHKHPQWTRDAELGGDKHGEGSCHGDPRRRGHRFDDNTPMAALADPVGPNSRS